MLLSFGLEHGQTFFYSAITDYALWLFRFRINSKVIIFQACGKSVEL
jgi:hypothetical protein